MLKHEEPPASVVDTRLYEQLNSGKPEAVSAASRALEQMGPEAQERLLALLTRESTKRRKNKRQFAALIAGLLAGMIVLIVVIGLIKGKLDPRLFAMFSSLSGLIAALYSVSNAQKNATKEMAAYDDIRAVGFFAEALEFQDKELRPLAEAKLIEMLPRLRASDVALLTPDQLGLLLKALRGKNVPLVRAILQALEQIGDQKAVPVVERLARGEGAAATSESLKQAAEQCLSALQERVRQHEASQSLLRASEAATTTPPETLLRPAHSPGETPTEQLLRPGGGTNG